MPKINPIKVKQEADKHEKAGRFDQAISCYQQIVETNARDWNSINKIGDLYARQNKLREAGREYAKVAEFYAQDGFLLKAIAIWKKINKLDSTALEPYLNLADLYAKQGLMMEAKSQYQIVVDEYVKRGKARDAADVLRKMVEIDPGDLKTRSKLADLYTRDGNKPRAVEEYVAIADELNKKGHLAEALQVLEKGLKLDPASNRLREELARIHTVQKNFERAAHFLEEAAQAAPDDVSVLGRLGEAYLGGKKLEEAEAIFRRLLEINPEDLESRARMGQLYLTTGELDQAFDELAPVVDRLLEQRQGDRAVALLQQIIQRNPAHVRTLVKLVEFYRIQHNDRAVLDTYSQLTEAYVKSGELDQAASVLDILIGLEPDNQQYRSKLEFVRAKLDQPVADGPISIEPDQAFGDLVGDDEFDLSLDDEPPAPGAAPAAAPRAAAPEPGRLSLPLIERSGTLSSEDQEFVDEHLAEGKVFSKYGLVDKALDQFEAVIARYPDNDEARREVAIVYEDKGDSHKAAQHYLALREIARLDGDSEAMTRYEDEARRLGGDAAAAALAEVASAPPSEAAPSPTPLDDFALDAGADEVSFDLDQEMSDAAEPAIEPPPPPAAAAEEEDLSLDEFSLDAAPEAPVADEEEFSLDLEEPERSAAPEEFSLDDVDAGPPEPAGVSMSPPVLEEFSLDDLDAGPPEPAGVSMSPPPAEEFSLDDLTAAPVMDAALSLDVPAAPPAPAAFSLDELTSEPVSGADDFSLGDFVSPASSPPADDLLGGLSALSGPAGGAADSLFDDLGASPTADDALAGLGIPSPLVARETGPAPVANVPPELLKALEDVDTYVGLGFVEDARAALRGVVGRFGEHEAVSARMSELGLHADALQPAPFAEPSGALLEGLDALVTAPELASRSEPAAADGGMLDLGSELSDLFGTQEAVDPNIISLRGETSDTDVSEVIAKFQRGVDKQLGAEDYDTRYNLGIAFKEMQLFDEAIGEFQKAAKDPARLLECSSMLGICFLEKGMPALAVKWFEKGLTQQGRADEEYQGLRYDLALAYEATGDAQHALALFSELYGQNAGFRDVATRVQELKAARG